MPLPFAAAAGMAAVVGATADCEDYLGKNDNDAEDDKFTKKSLPSTAPAPLLMMDTSNNSALSTSNNGHSRHRNVRFSSSPNGENSSLIPTSAATINNTAASPSSSSAATATATATTAVHERTKWQRHKASSFGNENPSHSATTTTTTTASNTTITDNGGVRLSRPSSSTTRHYHKSLFDYNDETDDELNNDSDTDTASDKADIIRQPLPQGVEEQEADITVPSPSNGHSQSSVKASENSQYISPDQILAWTQPPSANAYGFSQGNFLCGKIHDIVVDWVWTLSFCPHAHGHSNSDNDNDNNTDNNSGYHHSHTDTNNHHGHLLVLGLKRGLAFYDCSKHFSLIHYVELSSTPNNGDVYVSALEWLVLPGRNGNPNLLYLAVATLSGLVCLYQVDQDILESQGPTLLYQTTTPNTSEIRCLQLHKWGKLNPTIILCIGDKNGVVTIASFSSPNQEEDDGLHILGQDSKQLNSSILAMAFCSREGWLGLSTADGTVTVYQIRRNGRTMVTEIDSSNKVYTTIRNGAVRSILFSPALTTASISSFSNAASSTTRLIFGGYDKTVLLVNTEHWAVARELYVNGTINVIQYDPLHRYLAVGCRDRTLTLFDASTYIPIKTFHTPGWVTSISWACPSMETATSLLNNPSMEDVLDRDTYGSAAASSSSSAAASLITDWLVLRSDTTTISLIDLAPIHLLTHTRLSSKRSRNGSSDNNNVNNNALSWNSRGRWLARARGSTCHIADAWYGFRDVASIDSASKTSAPSGNNNITNLAFAQNNTSSNNQKSNVVVDDSLAILNENGFLMIVNVGMHRPTTRPTTPADSKKEGFHTHSCSTTYREQVLHLQETCSIHVAPDLKACAWSNDAKIIAVGGKDKTLYTYTFATATTSMAGSNNNKGSLVPYLDPIPTEGHIWEIAFCPMGAAQRKKDDGDRSDNGQSAVFLALALGDQTALFLNESFDPVLKIVRNRTVRCLSFHPFLPLLATGDSAGMISLVDYEEEEIVLQMSAGERVNALDFSPQGDFLMSGSDDCRFLLHETSSLRFVQEIKVEGFALTTCFSPDGRYVASGSSNEAYSLLKMGPLLGMDLVPLGSDEEALPLWAMNEALHRSTYGPSLVQRQMSSNLPGNLKRLAYVIKSFPSAIFTYNRSTGEGCFDTALALKKPNLIKLMVTALVDGTLDKTAKTHSHGQQPTQSILNSTLPCKGRTIMEEIICEYPPQFAVEIFEKVAFTKVPFARERIVRAGDRLECGSRSYTDPWNEHLDKDSRSKKQVLHAERSLDLRKEHRAHTVRTAAVLPLPGLGEMDFLSDLLTETTPDVFDNEALALVLRVMWADYIRRYFYIDCTTFLIYYFCWIVLVEFNLEESDGQQRGPSEAARIAMAAIVLLLNTIYACKEIIQSRYGRREHYWMSIWNSFDICAVMCVYLYVGQVFFDNSNKLPAVPLAVSSSLLLTVKLLSYLRGFSQTGWLISVLIANFRDSRGFLIILFVILTGFSIAFRQLFGPTGNESYGSLRRAFLATFEATITGSYETETLFESDHTALAILTFILAVTCVLVVALNALISVLSDSFARVQEHAVANRRREQAFLVVEYLSLLPPWERRRIENETRWFHKLLEVDADGDLLLDNEDWQGGLNALKKDLEELAQDQIEENRKAMAQLKSELQAEVNGMKKDVLQILQGVQDDLQHMRHIQQQGSITLSGKNVARAVKAVQSVGRKGGKLFNPSA